MTRYRFLVAAAAAAVLVAVTSSRPALRATPLGQNDVTITLSNPAYHPRLAVPDFLVADDDKAELGGAATAIADVLWNDLDFEREFYLIGRKVSARVPLAPADALPADRWTALGADAVIVGTLVRTGNDMAVEIRAISVKGDDAGHQFFGVRYSHCKPDDVRPCAHQIADDFHKQVRGLDGVARTKLAFVSDRDGGRLAGRPGRVASKEIYWSDYDGANQTRFTSNGSINMSPAWSPDNRHLAYVSWMNGPPDIFVADLHKPERKPDRPGDGNVSVQDWSPAWSPDGKHIAFASTRSGNLDVWVADADGDHTMNLTNNPASDGAPTWSPDGTQIAFTSDRGGENELYIMSASGTGLTKLVAQQVDRPAWSSLGFIAFTVGTGPGHDIAIWDFNNPGVKVLTDGVGTNEDPAIAPNGRHIAFDTTRWGRHQIAIIDRAGGGLRQITTTGNNQFPSWGPMPRE